MKTEIKIKHLELIQGVINRLANNSFLIKGWALTVSMTGFGFYVNQKQSSILLITLFGALTFWFLDGYFLKQERLFRRLYSDVANGRKLNPFSMDTTSYKKSAASVIEVMFSYPTRIFYLVIFVIGGILYYYD